jgi:hypothetical protein
MFAFAAPWMAIELDISVFGGRVSGANAGAAELFDPGLTKNGTAGTRLARLRPEPGARLDFFGSAMSEGWPF